MKGTPEEKLECMRLFISVSIFPIQLIPCVLPVSFKLYDMDHDGYLTQAELERVMTQLVSLLPPVRVTQFHLLQLCPYFNASLPQSLTFSSEDQTNEIRELITRMFEDVDVNGDGKLVRINDSESNVLETPF
jgi:EF-hand domain pair